MTISLPAISRFIESFLRLTRFWNLLIIALAQYFTAYFLVNKGTANDLKLLVLVVSTLSIAGQQQTSG